MKRRSGAARTDVYFFKPEPFYDLGWRHSALDYLIPDDSSQVFRGQERSFA